MTTASIINATDLGVSYGARPVFDALNLALPAGLHLLQGPNGSGKSTLLRILAGAQAADHGSIAIDGFDLLKSPREARRRLAYIPAESPIYDFMTGRQFLEFIAGAKSLSVDAALLQFADDLGLTPYLDRRHDELSLGTQKKLLLCTALIGPPAAILMDEPTNGLDEAAGAALRMHLAALATNAAILCVSHDPSLLAIVGAQPIAMGDLARKADWPHKSGDRRGGHPDVWLGA